MARGLSGQLIPASGCHVLSPTSMLLDAADDGRVRLSSALMGVCVCLCAHSQSQLILGSPASGVGCRTSGESRENPA